MTALQSELQKLLYPYKVLLTADELIWLTGALPVDESDLTAVQS